MAKPYLNTAHQSRINPQFVGISQRYSQTRKQRQEKDQLKHSKQKLLNYSQRNNQSLSQVLSRKKKQLKWLKSVRERHLSDIRYKIERQEHKNEKIQQLRQKSQNARKQHEKNMKDIINKTKKQKLKASQQIKSQLQEINKFRLMNEQQKEQLAQLRIKEKSENKDLRGSKINSFFRKKNKKLLNSYREMIKNEESKTQKSQELIQFIQRRSIKIDTKIAKKKDKLKSIEAQIEKLKELQEKDIMESKSTYREKVNRSSVDFSRVSKKSSKPIDLLMKDSYTTQLRVGK